jgi:hypothetical protein
MEKKLRRVPPGAPLLGDVFAANGELFGRFDAHFDTPAGAAQQGDLDGPVGEQLSHGHVGVHPVGGLNDNGFVSSAAEH